MEKYVTPALSRQVALSICDYTCFLGRNLTEEQFQKSIAFLVGVLLSHLPKKKETCDDIVDDIAARTYAFLQKVHSSDHTEKSDK